MKCRLILVVLAVALLTAGAAAWGCPPINWGRIIYVKWDCFGPTHDGTSWGTAYQKVVEGLNDATSGDEVWVAQGTYNERNLELKDGVKLLGGYSGSGTGRNWNLFVTTLSASGPVLYANTGVTETAVLQGFTITGTGYYTGSGVLISGSASPTITHNIFCNCTAQYNGGAISTGTGSTKVINNLFRQNNCSQDGGAINIGANGSPTIVNNTFVDNTADSGGAFMIQNGATPVIENNIIFGSTGYGIYNNGGTPTLINNDLYNNSPGNYYGVDPGATDIQVDPLFFKASAGEYHLADNSPCVDAGASQGAPENDKDLRVRPGDGDGDGTAICDIGCFEFRRIHVTMDGSDSNDGSSWTLAKRTVSNAISSAIEGDQIWVAAGSYYGSQLLLRRGIKLYGGFAGTESHLSQRNWQTNISNLHGNRTGAVISMDSNATEVTVIDGLKITGGGDSIGGSLSGAGICCLGSATIANNWITNNIATQFGNAMVCWSCSPIVENNKMEGNSGAAGTLACVFGGTPKIRRNTIRNNTASEGGGIFCYECSPEIINNSITGNTSDGGYGGGGICVFDGSSPTIINNTIAANECPSSSGGGIFCYEYTAPVINNNIVAWNKCWTGLGAGICCFTPTGATLDYNDVYGNWDYSMPPITCNYYGVAPGPHDISVDPQFAAWYHLQDDSDCIDAGDNDSTQPGWLDIDGQPRIIDGDGDSIATVDMGADEYQP